MLFCLYGSYVDFKVVDVLYISRKVKFNFWSLVKEEMKIVYRRRKDKINL